MTRPRLQPEAGREETQAPSLAPRIRNCKACGTHHGGAGDLCRQCTAWSEYFRARDVASRALRRATR